MKFLRLLVGGHLLGIFFLLGTTPHLVSCTKETKYDTVLIRDTLVITDTITRVDTICNLKAGMVAYYNFDDGSLQDGSGFNNHIVFNSATPTTDRFGNANGAYLFDGSSSYMRATNSASLSPQKITLVAIVKVNDFYQGTCHANQIFGKGYPDPVLGYYNLRFMDTYSDCYAPVNQNKQFFIGTYGDDIPQGTASFAGIDTSLITKETWYTVVYTYDGEQSKLYVNGELKHSQQKAVTFTANPFDLLIGRHQDPEYPYWFNGVIDELRIYDRALCACEIDQINLKNDVHPQ